MDSEKRIKSVALAGNPNVGKSTFFNALTGMRQHTGNWPGKTVKSAVGTAKYGNTLFKLIDLPGTYSLMSHSEEEECARGCICFDKLDAIAVICDATVLERNLILALQILEIRGDSVIALNLMDEAERKKVHIDINGLSRLLNTRVVSCAARSGKGLKSFLEAIDSVNSGAEKGLHIDYGSDVEEAIAIVRASLDSKIYDGLNRRFLSIKLIEGDESMISAIEANTGERIGEGTLAAVERAREWLLKCGTDTKRFKEIITYTLVKLAEKISSQCISQVNPGQSERDRRLDRFLTSKATGIPIMVILLLLLLFITLIGANYPSGLLFDAFHHLENTIYELLMSIGISVGIVEALVHGMLRTLFWVVSVMLPPMAIFFPLFTLLEDFGYLPRIAFNLDWIFKKCSACGKQALSMCMGLGCNAAGVMGCRIIDSPRERMIAIVTNNFMPCNGRFPTYIALISMFFIVGASGLVGSTLSALLLTGIIILGILATFLVSFLLSKTVLKGAASSFTLELPPYRAPEIGKVIVRSIFDRTLRVLGRAVVVAAPAGLVIYALANIQIDGANLLNIISGFLDPFARFIGLDGAILLAFILAFPANEIVVPIIITIYLQSSSIMELESIFEMKELFVQFGWTWRTAICVILFSLLHWPCSTTVLTIQRETGSWRWTAAAVAIPTAVGIVICALVANI